MKVSLSWLKEYVPIELDVASLAEALTMAGLEVEMILDRYAYLDTVVIGKITQVLPHPNADSLVVCKVDIGEQLIDIVCGAPNARQNLLSPVAMPGTLFPGGLLLEKTTIRGIESSGMLCSEAELGLGSDQEGIMELQPGLPPGQRLANALNLSDSIFEIGLTPNRSDCLSVIGIAREIAAIQKTPLRYPVIPLNDTTDKISTLTSVCIETPDHCPRYSARLVENISVRPSPFWLQDRLLSIGQRPINAIVDITNFVMMEFGQPLHAFDFDRLAENRIVVRTATEGETFITLDDKQRILDDEMLMICDGKRPVAVAGMMGGQNSEIQPDTRNVLIESAYFNPVSIRKTAKKLGLNTEASHRFERGVDPEGTIKAMNRAALLMSQICGGKIVPGLIDEHPLKSKPACIHLNVPRTNQILGVNHESSEMKSLLESIEFEVTKSNNYELTVKVPTYRVDVSRPEDLMEEIARLSGYNHIPTTYPMVPATERAGSPKWNFIGRVKEIMCSLGFVEAINYSFIDPKTVDNMRLNDEDPLRNLLHILNPLTEDQSVMRTSLIPGLLKNVSFNFSQQIKHLKLFEVGNIFISQGQESLPHEIEYLAGIWTGLRQNFSWHSRETECDFFDLKGAVEALFRSLGVNNADFLRLKPALCTYTKPGYSAQILIDDQPAGLIGELHPKVSSNFSLKQNVFLFELNLSCISSQISDSIHYQPIPKYPFISRDITVILDRHVEARDIVKVLNLVEYELIESIDLIDVFEGEPIPKGKKSVSLRITYRSLEKTLEDTDVTPVTEKIAHRLMDELGAKLP
jgi:phenylalanyl-tRNA synthetase beta chain